MATKKNAAPKVATKVAAGFPAKSAPAKAIIDNAAKVIGTTAAAKKPTRAKKAVASTKPMRVKAAARPPAVLAKSGKLLGADPKGVPGTKTKLVVKRFVGDTGLPAHEVHDVAGLMKVLDTFPTGATFNARGVPGEHGSLRVSNMRGREIAEIVRIAKPAKGAKK